MTPPPSKHAELLTTRWWSRQEFRQHGMSCHEGQYTLKEMERVQDAIRRYQEAKGITQEDVEDLVLGEVRRDGFWEDITRTVPGRHVCLVHDHAQILYEPYRDQGNWTMLEDSRLENLVNQCLNWVDISRSMLRSASACRNRYHRHVVHHNMQHTSPWSDEEEARLFQVIQDMQEDGKAPRKTPKFWKLVSEQLDGTQTRDQCRNKWCDSLSPTAKNDRRVRWHNANSKTLVHKVAGLNLEREDDIPWAELIDEGWNVWPTDKLRERWATLKARVDTNATHHASD
ncbi:hypothetical protein EI94DRAFT_1808180 [Lactarius quietus]|nr:hypothetical protein EI94DRAFT_1808180 [Lactarius quietus]